MKRNAYLIMAGLMLVGMLFLFTACSGGNHDEEKMGALVCGVTNYEPMNFKDDQGNWVGFDTEFALMVGEKLNLKVEFQEIVWESKYLELDSGAIDCIWNGFTANTEDDGIPRSETVDLSYSYMLNEQCVVIKASRDSEFKTERSLIGKTAAAEKGSAGENYAVTAVGDSGKMIDSPSQTGTFLEVKSGAVDFAVVDILLAQKLAGTGDYSDLKIADIGLDSEVYAIAFKKGSELTAKINKAIKELYDEGKLLELAKKYKLENQLVLETGAVATTRSAEEEADAEEETDANAASEAKTDTETTAGSKTDKETGTDTEKEVDTKSESITDTETETETDTTTDTEEEADAAADAKSGTEEKAE